MDTQAIKDIALIVQQERERVIAEYRVKPSADRLLNALRRIVD